MIGDGTAPAVRRRGVVLVAAVLAAAALVGGSALVGPPEPAHAAVAIGKPDKPGKPGGGSGGGGGSTELDYAAAGDSFAAGVGARNYLDASCYRSASSYPKLLDADANVRLVAFAACSGASTATVIAAQVPAIPTTSKRVSLTVGGNDIGFADIMQSCFVLQSSICESRIVSGETLVANGTLATNVATAVQAIRARAPEARVIVTGYPLLFNEPNAKYQWAARVNQGTVLLNDAIEATALANGAVFVDVEAAFAGHGVGSASPWINDWSWLRTTDGFHPTATGYSAYASEVRKVIG
jgi:lysophospholipase L1-like esterase